MRLDFNIILLLPAAVAASIIEVALAQPDTTTTALPSAPAATVNGASNAAPQAADVFLAIQTQSPALAGPVAAPHLGRSYNPNPAFLQPAPAAAELAPREIVTGVAQGVGVTANVGHSQVPPVTTYWPAMKINGVLTYPEIVYTQTFAAVPDQWPSYGVGRIGYAESEADGSDGGDEGNTKRALSDFEERSAGSAAGVSTCAVVGVAALVGVLML